MNMFNLSAGRDCRKNAGSLSVILTGGATDKPCNCSSYIRTPSLKYTNSISQCQIEPTPHTPDAIVASAFVARIVLTFQSSRFAGMPLKHLWVRWPWRRTGRSSTPDLDVHKKDLFHGGNTRSRHRCPQKGPISWTNGPIEDCFATRRWHWSTCGLGCRAEVRPAIGKRPVLHRFQTVLPRGVGTEVLVGRVAVPKTGQKTASPRGDGTGVPVGGVS